MKLKKIASLALAGVMAVGMLAGCAGAADDNKDEDTTVVAGSLTSGVVAGLNADAGVKAKGITVTAGDDAALRSTLEDFVDKYGDDAWTDTGYQENLQLSDNAIEASDLQGTFKTVTGADYDVIGAIEMDNKVGSSKTAVKLYAVNASVSNALIVDKIVAANAASLASLPVSDVIESNTELSKLTVAYDYTVSVVFVEDSINYNYYGTNDGHVKYVAVKVVCTSSLDA